LLVVDWKGEVEVLFTGILGLVLILFMWSSRDVEGGAKIILTLMYLGSWLLVLVNPGLALAGQAIVALVVGGMTFGVEWLT